VLVNTPVYPPFLTAPLNQGRTVHAAPLAASHRKLGGVDALSFELDIGAIEDAVTPDTGLFLLCSPHNPIGRAWSRPELETLAAFCLRHDLTVCSDEIHSDLVLDNTHHLPIAALAPEIAARSVTLLAPSKSFNVPGLGCSMAIVPDAGLRARLLQASAGIVPHVNVLGYVAALAAYTECEEWLTELCRYLTANRDFAVEYITRCMPSLHVTLPQATYLEWIDCRQTRIEGNPFQFFLRNAKVALNDGAFFGENGRGFVRLNFGCPRATLHAALERMAAALSALE
jgi:cystathionine beta-lyase